MNIRDWYYILEDNGTLYIYVIDEQENEMLASTISDCKNLSKAEQESLAKEVLFCNLGYKEIV